MLNKINEAIEQLKNDKLVVIVDDGNIENEGYLILPTDLLTKENLDFISKHTTGELNTVIQEVAADEEKSDATLSEMHKEIMHKGHTFLAVNGGVLKKAGINEAAIDLLILAEMNKAAIFGKVSLSEGSETKLPELISFAKSNECVVISIEDLISYRRERECYVVREAEANLPTAYGDFHMVGFVNTLNAEHHVALVKGEINEGDRVLVRVHSECLTGDAFHSLKCDCGEQLAAALSAIEKEGKGILVYLRQEGRGIGLINKIKAYKLQDEGMDTEEANIALGFPPDLRDYGIGAQILSLLKAKQIRLLTNNPKKVVGLKGHGIEIVERVPLVMDTNLHNEKYFLTKKEKMGHLY